MRTSCRPRDHMVTRLFPCESCVTCGTCPAVLTVYMQEVWYPCDPATGIPVRENYDRAILDLDELLPNGYGTESLVPAGAVVDTVTFFWEAFGATAGGSAIGDRFVSRPIGQTTCLPLGGVCPTVPGNFAYASVPQGAGEHILSVIVDYTDSESQPQSRVFYVSTVCQAQGGGGTIYPVSSVAGEDTFVLDTVEDENICRPCVSVVKKTLLVCSGGVGRSFFLLRDAGPDATVVLTISTAGVTASVTMTFCDVFWYRDLGDCTRVETESDVYYVELNVASAITEVTITGGPLEGVYPLGCFEEKDAPDAYSMGCGTPAALDADGSGTCGPSYFHNVIMTADTYSVVPGGGDVGCVACPAESTTHTSTSSPVTVAGTISWIAGCSGKFPRRWTERAFEMVESVAGTVTTGSGATAYCELEVSLSKLACSDNIDYIATATLYVTLVGSGGPLSTGRTDLHAEFTFPCSSRVLKINMGFNLSSAANPTGGCLVVGKKCVDGWETSASISDHPTLNYDWGP